jgi:hypothetical protein
MQKSEGEAKKWQSEGTKQRKSKEVEKEQLRSKGSKAKKKVKKRLHMKKHSACICRVAK